jgi:hypothetical protein
LLGHTACLLIGARLLCGGTAHNLKREKLICSVKNELRNVLHVIEIFLEGSNYSMLERYLLYRICKNYILQKFSIKIPLKKLQLIYYLKKKLFRTTYKVWCLP